MLIATIPKSAGTALMETLARAHALPCDMHFKWNGPLCTDFPKYHLQHSFGGELCAADVAEMTRPGLIYKTHILPSDNNLALLKNHRKVILLRRAEGVIGAYKRGEETGVYRQKTRLFKECSTLEDWMARAQELGLYRDLEAFRARWLAADGDQLVVHYKKLVTETASEIARIERYFGLPLSGTTTLLKRKFTRQGAKSMPYHMATRDSWKTAGRD